MVHLVFFMLVSLFSLVLLLPTLPLEGQAREVASVIDDFERDQAGAPPSRWNYISRRGNVIPLQMVMDERQKFCVVEERGNKFLRAYTQGKAQRASIASEDLDWDLTTHPWLRWEWRALRLPEGAREDRVDDAGGAIYVTFDKRDWLGRPYSIKYTYSSSLPVGTVVSSGNVKVIVASSGTDGMGKWVRVERDIIEDYRRVFGGDPPDQPFSVTLWSDSDTTNSTSEVDFDNIALLPARN